MTARDVCALFHEAGMRLPADPPSYDPTGVSVEGHIDEAGPGRDVGGLLEGRVDDRVGDGVDLRMHAGIRFTAGHAHVAGS